MTGHTNYVHCFVDFSYFEFCSVIYHILIERRDVFRSDWVGFSSNLDLTRSLNPNPQHGQTRGVWTCLCPKSHCRIYVTAVQAGKPVLIEVCRFRLSDNLVWAFAVLLGKREKKGRRKKHQQNEICNNCDDNFT